MNPDGWTVTRRSLQIAARLLDGVVAYLDSGALEVLMLGERGLAEAVMIPVDCWLDYLGLERVRPGTTL